MQGRSATKHCLLWAKHYLLWALWFVAHFRLASAFHVCNAVTGGGGYGRSSYGDQGGYGAPLCPALWPLGCCCMNWRRGWDDWICAKPEGALLAVIWQLVLRRGANLTAVDLQSIKLHSLILPCHVCFISQQVQSVYWQLVSTSDPVLGCRRRRQLWWRRPGRRRRKAVVRGELVGCLGGSGVTPGDARPGQGLGKAVGAASCP